MNRLFWGLLFVLIDFKMTVGSAVFDLLPDFIGFYLVMKGMESLSGNSVHFDRGRHLAFAMTILSTILYGMELMNPDMTGKLWIWALGLAGQILMIVILSGAVRGIRELEGENRGSEGLHSLLIVVAVLQILAHLMGWVPVVGKVCGAAALIGSVCFLIVFRREISNR